MEPLHSVSHCSTAAFKTTRSDLLLLCQRQIEFFAEPARPVGLLYRPELRQKLLRLGPVSLAGAALVLATVDAVTNPPVLGIVLSVELGHSETVLRYMCLYASIEIH